MTRPLPDVWVELDDGVEVLAYGVCTACHTLQTRIESTHPIVCRDCHNVEVTA